MRIDNGRLLELIPHRPPILMLDEVVDVVPGERGAGVRIFFIKCEASVGENRVANGKLTLRI